MYFVAVNAAPRATEVLVYYSVQFIALIDFESVDYFHKYAIIHVKSFGWFIMFTDTDNTFIL